MKKNIVTVVIGIILVFGYVDTGSAALIDRGNGMIYDDDLDITWLSDANYAQTSGYDADGYMTYIEAKTWAENLVYGGFNDWRLPRSEYSVGYDGTNAEFVHLFYSEMGGSTFVSIFGVNDPDLALFSNTNRYFYWIDNSNNTDRGYMFEWGIDMTPGYFTASGSAWAVRSGDVVSQNQSPVAVAGGISTVGLAPLNAELDGSQSYDPEGGALSYDWDFGDNTIGFGAYPDHTYTTAGFYIATLTVTDDSGLTDQASVAILVTGINSPPTVTPAATLSNGLTVQLVANGSDADGDSLIYEWDFGDGSPVSADENPFHTYASQGTYVASVTVSDGEFFASGSVTIMFVPLCP